MASITNLTFITTPAHCSHRLLFVGRAAGVDYGAGNPIHASVTYRETKALWQYMVGESSEGCASSSFPFTRVFERQRNCCNSKLF